MTLLRRMLADILFLDPNDMNPGVAALTELGFDVEVLDDWIDECGPTVFIRAQITTELDEDRFFNWVSSIVEQFRSGDVIEAGLADYPQQVTQSYDFARAEWRRLQ
jgi:hypothetical protein